jgi:hypothetical protein
VNQLNTDTFPLVRYPHRKVGQVTDVAKVRERARYSNQQVAIPGGDDEIRVPEHVRHDLPIIHRSSFTESGSVVKLDDLIEIQLVAVLIPNTGHFKYSTESLQKCLSRQEATETKSETRISKAETGLFGTF